MIRRLFTHRRRLVTPSMIQVTIRAADLEDESRREYRRLESLAELGATATMRERLERMFGEVEAA